VSELSKAFKALSDENRLAIVKLLLCKDFCVRALSRKIGISEPAISQHLKILREAGMIKGEKKGYFIHYQVNRERLLWVAKSIQELAEPNRQEGK